MHLQRQSVRFGDDVQSVHKLTFVQRGRKNRIRSLWYVYMVLLMSLAVGSLSTFAKDMLVATRFSQDPEEQLIDKRSAGNETTNTANWTKSTGSPLNDSISNITQDSLNNNRLNLSDIVSKMTSSAIAGESLFPNCTPPAVNQFPADVFTHTQRRHGAILIHVFVSLYMFAALAVVCDEYFVSSLESISERLQLQSDVAGATFMAAGSSAPELFTSIIGVFVTKDDVGIGTIVGSAVFNLLCILALCGILAGMAIQLSWWPLLRDTIYYLISIVALATVMSDEIIHWYDAAFLLVLYAFYIVLMYFNENLSEFAMERVKVWKHRYQKVSAEEKSPLVVESFQRIQKGTTEKNNEEIEMDNPLEKGLIAPYHSDGKHSEEKLVLSNENDNTVKTVDEDKEETRPIMNGTSVSIETPETVEKILDDGSSKSSSLLDIPDGLHKKVLWLLGFPIYGVLFITVPDCRTERWQKWYLLTFFTSILWITAFSYILVWMITLIGDTLNIPDEVMGLTVLAAGTSVPDALASVLVARDGYGDMAVSNSIGSNIFDVLLCLGLPWFLKTALISPGGSIYIYGSGLTYTTLMLIATVTILLFSITLNKWQLDKKLGYIFFLIYTVFIAFALMYELNVFGVYNLPVCSL